MLGSPKYKQGDEVRFVLDGEEFVGMVYIVDRWGTFEDSRDVSYDILVDGVDRCLYKHVSEGCVVGLKS